MKSDESTHALPAWLQEEPSPDPEATPARRGFRRSGRSAGPAGAQPVPPQPVRPADAVPQTADAAPSTEAPPVVPPTPIASVPFGAPPVMPLAAAAPAVGGPEEPVPSPADRGGSPGPGEAVPVVESGPPVPAPAEPVSCPVPDPDRAREPSPKGARDVPPAAPPIDRSPQPSRPPVEPRMTVPVEPRVTPQPAGRRPPQVEQQAPQVEQQPPSVGQLPQPLAPGFDHQPSSLDLDSGVLVKRSRRSPSSGWRRSVHRLTGGILSPGESAGESHEQDLVDRIRQPIGGDYRIAVLSLKGGVGKTTTTVGLGSTFASLRGDCVIAVDANPDFGTLAQRLPQQTRSTVRDLLAAAPNIERYSDVRAHTSQASSRLEVLASERDPAVSEAFSEADYRQVIEVLQVYYNIILTDCGTGIMHSAMRGVLDLANALVLVSSPAIDGARSAAATLDWLQHHGFEDLVARTVVVVSAARPGASNIDMEALTAHFLARCRAVQVVPFDEHLAEGAELDLELMRPATRRAFAELAAMVADDFPPASGRHAVGW
ncbi:MinD/ParA family ATP-binding protein [Rhodococcus zopfii]|uniref:MinD/ParA family ATP-binding protein n=1 Tax=Rhodococcus zopfii TaxID=43772 RepID=UPI001F0CF81D|nr:MinD/ParA family protein [Rhodococcus zopfii]